MKSLKDTPTYFGLLMLSSFIAFFFVMKALGLYTELNLRFLNVLIHGTLIFLAMRAFRKGREDRLHWGRSFLIGVHASMIGVLGFAAFQAIYLAFINPGFLVYVQEHAILGEFLTPWNASLFLVAEGAAATVFFSYLSMRYLDNQEHEHDYKPEQL